MYDVKICTAVVDNFITAIYARGAVLLATAAMSNWCGSLVLARGRHFDVKRAIRKVLPHISSYCKFNFKMV